MITQIYDAECPYTNNDSVYAVKDDIIVHFEKVDNDDKDLVGKVEYKLDYDISLATESSIQKQELPPRQDKMLKLNCNNTLQKIDIRDSALLQK